MASVPTNPGETVPPDVIQVVDHLFRREAGKMIATLTRILGFENLQLAEDVVQDALLKAMQNWAFSGVPRNPSPFDQIDAGKGRHPPSRRSTLGR